MIARANAMIWTIVSLTATVSICGAQETKPDNPTSPKAPAYNPAEDVKFLTTAGLGTDNASLLSYFRDRILSAEDEAKVADLVKQLSNPDFDTRIAATEKLKAMGGRIRLYVEKAAESDDPEVMRRAREVLAKIKHESSEEVVLASVRLLAHRNPKGTTDALLEYLPLVKDSDDYLLEAFRDAFIALAVNDGKTNPRLLKAVSADDERARATAIEALIRAGALNYPKGKKHLKDSSPLVRLRAALTFVEKEEEKEAVPVLVNLLPELPADTAWREVTGEFRNIPKRAGATAGKSEDNARSRVDFHLFRCLCSADHRR